MSNLSDFHILTPAFNLILTSFVPKQRLLTYCPRQRENLFVTGGILIAGLSCQNYTIGVTDCQFSGIFLNVGWSHNPKCCLGEG